MIVATKAALGANSTTYRWVAVGATGNLATSDSTTASSWTARTSSFGTTQINAVASDGAGFYVAVGNAGKLATSPDGITWTQRANPFSTNDINDVAYGNGVWVAVGGPSGGGTLATATDPTGTWTSRTTGATTPINKIAYGAGLWALIQSNGTYRTATDPTGTWTTRSGTVGSEFTRYNPIQAVWDVGYAAATATNNIASSTDGTTFTTRSLPNTTGIAGAGEILSNSSVIAIAYRSSGAACDIATSTDGIAWTDRTPAITATAVTAAAVDSGGFMVFANGTNVQTSSDGTTWTSRTGPTFTPLGLCHASTI